ncbi:hypothetical protein EI94DRAFT_1773032 [Lactarius quietus]|nr:hypothetical protein EI94DRAFT_1773032 [Lactarius quietus]
MTRWDNYPTADDQMVWDSVEPILPPPPPQALFEPSDNPWHPFGHRLEYEWAHYHYIRLQSLADDIQCSLDLWRATVKRYHADNDSRNKVPWKNAKEMYESIDSISAGGPESYELNVRDVLSVFEEQLVSRELDGQFEYMPYEEYDSKGSQIYSNLMSGNWAYREADTISEDENTHGSMLIPVVAGSDKTTVSVATRHQEYHPVYVSLGNITSTARRGHGNGILFCRQLYHSCLELVFASLKPYMTEPKVVKCPDGHFHHAIFSLGPYIADYPEQVWLTGVVSKWCPKCDAQPTNLDGPESHRRSHTKTDLLIKTFSPRVLWDDFGVRHNIVPFTYSFPCADIHELLAPDLLHQLIKGIFKDHLVEWVLKYLHVTHGEKASLEIIEDIDRRISAVPPFSGLRRFPDGRDYKQWTGDDSKALMKVFLAAITGYLPSVMVRSIVAFMDACYITRRNAINSIALEHLRNSVDMYHELRSVFVQAGVRNTLSLPHQHALMHFYHAIHLFGSPNGLCSSITESKHIETMKDTWRRTSRYYAIYQMLRILFCMAKMLALHRRLQRNGMLRGFCHGASSKPGNDMKLMLRIEDSPAEDLEEKDEWAAPGKPDSEDVVVNYSRIRLSEPGYPSRLHDLAAHINQPKFPLTFTQFLYKHRHPEEPIAPSTIEECPAFDGVIKVHHSAVARFYAPSDLSRSGGLRHERIRSMPNFFGHPRCDTIFVVTNNSQPGMKGMEIGCVLLFFSFEYRREKFSCALINWFVHADEHDLDTGMWVVKQEFDHCGEPTIEVIHLDSIARAAHLLPVYRQSHIPEEFEYHTALDTYNSFFINHYVDHHTHEFIGRD